MIVAFHESETFIVLASFIYLFLLYILVKIKDKEFNSTDPKPTLLPLSNILVADSTKLITINTGLFIKDFSKFDMVQNQFSMNALVWFEFDRGVINIDALDQFTFENAVKIKQLGRTLTLHENKILVQYSINVQFSSTLDHKYFPLNDHHLFITITNDYFSPTEVKFAVEAVNINYSADLDIQDWNIAGKEASAGYIDVVLDESTGKKTQHPRVVYSLKLKKAGLRKTFLIILPIILIFFVSSSTIWEVLNPEHLSMLTTAIGCLTGVLAYRFVINSMSPNVSYGMFFEYIYNIALFFIFFNFVFVLNNELIFYQFHHVTLGAFLYFFSRLTLISSFIYFLFFRQEKNESTDSKAYQKYLEKYKKSILFNQITRSDLLCLATSLTSNNTKYSRFKEKIKKAMCFLKKEGNPFLSNKFLLNLFIQFESMCVSKNSVVKLPVMKTGQCVLFHSATDLVTLIQHLTQLMDIHFLDHNLCLIQPECYIIFNGNMTGGSAHVLETLAVIITLKLKNPSQVFFIEGPQERYQNWKNQVALAIKRRFPSKINASMNQLISTLLSTWPIAIYLPYYDTQQRYVRISCFDEESVVQDNTAFRNFLLGTDTLETYELLSSELPRESTLDLPFVANICQNKREDFHDDLMMVLPHHAATVWTLPVSHCGAFLMLTLQQDRQCYLTVLKTTPSFTLCYQTTRFHLIYGYHISESPQAFPLEDFIIGSTMDLSRTSSVVSTRLRYGLYAKIMAQNFKDLDKQPIQLKVFDDEYMPVLAKKNVAKLIETLPQKIILSPVGTPTLESYFPRILKKELLVLFPLSGGTFFRIPECTHVIAVRASFAEEGQVLLKYAVEVKDLSRIAVFYQNDSYGLGALQGIESLLNDYQVDWLPVPYQRNNLDPDEAASKIINFSADTIIFFSTAAPAIALVHQLGVQRVADMTLLAISYASNSFQEFLQSIGISLTRTHVSPNLNSDIEMVKEYHQVRQQSLFHFPASDESLEGYMNASIFYYILQAIRPPYTKEKIIEYVTTIKNQNFKGLTLDFNSNTREIFHEIWIETR